MHAEIIREDGTVVSAEIANLTRSSVFVKADSAPPFRSRVRLRLEGMELVGETALVCGEPRGFVVAFEAPSELKLSIAALQDQVDVLGDGPWVENTTPSEPPEADITGKNTVVVPEPPPPPPTPLPLPRSPSRMPTPQDFQDRLSPFRGAAFGLEPVLTQSAWFRPHNRSEDIERLYLVGAGTHPGAGLPGVLSSARILDTVVPHADTLARPAPGGAFRAVPGTPPHVDTANPAALA